MENLALLLDISDYVEETWRCSLIMRDCDCREKKKINNLSVDVSGAGVDHVCVLAVHAAVEG